jgi:hypothetical protein
MHQNHGQGYPATPEERKAVVKDPNESHAFSYHCVLTSGCTHAFAAIEGPVGLIHQQNPSDTARRVVEKMGSPKAGDVSTKLARVEFNPKGEIFYELFGTFRP